MGVRVLFKIPYKNLKFFRLIANSSSIVVHIILYNITVIIKCLYRKVNDCYVDYLYC